MEKNFTCPVCGKIYKSAKEMADCIYRDERVSERKKKDEIRNKAEAMRLEIEKKEKELSELRNKYNSFCRSNNISEKPKYMADNETAMESLLNDFYKIFG